MRLRTVISTTLTFLLTMCLAVGCIDNNSDNVSDNKEEEVQQVQDSNEMNFVVVDNEYITMTILEKYEDTEWSEVGYKVKIENKSDLDLLISIDGVSVDGVMNDPFWATSVMAGKTSYDNIYWYTNGDNNPNVRTTDDLKNVEFELDISDDDTWDELYNVNIVIE